MLSFVAQRVLKGVIVLLAIVVLNFFLIRLAPGDPAVVMAGEAGASDQVFVKQLREKFGLDKPLPEQLFIYVKGVVTLDLGFSFRQQAPVSKLILERLPATLLLTLTAFAISLVLGILFGTFAARFARTWLDTAITIFALIFIALTIDSHMKFGELTHADAITPAVIEGKHVWHRKNCINCHTLLGEGAYYAPDLTKIAQHRGEAYLRQFLRDPSKYYSEERHGRLMPNPNLSDDQIGSVLTFVRRSFGHDSDPVDPAKVQSIRDWTQAKKDGWTEKELLEVR